MPTSLWDPTSWSLPVDFDRAAELVSKGQLNGAFFGQDEGREQKEPQYITDGKGRAGGHGKFLYKRKKSQQCDSDTEQVRSTL